nr:hypothetical protein [Bacteroidota bacterium]
MKITKILKTLLPVLGIASITNCFAQCVQTTGTATINSYTVWTGTIHQDKHITINAGGALVINNLTLSFPEGCYITVNAGGRLQVTNSTLQAFPDCTWGGIKVTGPAPNPNYTSQYYYDGSFSGDQVWQVNMPGQAVFTSINLSSGWTTIQNANTAVFVENGGIVNVKHVHFKNNFRAIQLTKFIEQNANALMAFGISSAHIIEECKFELTTLSNVEDGPGGIISNFLGVQQVKIEEIQGIEIGGCEFYNNYPSPILSR